MKSWKLEDAKNRFSEVVRLALGHEPQLVTRNGREAVVVLSAEEYGRLTDPPEDLFTFLQSSPLAEALAAGEIDLDRPLDFGRDVDL